MNPMIFPLVGLIFKMSSCIEIAFIAIICYADVLELQKSSCPLWAVIETGAAPKKTMTKKKNEHPKSV